MIQPAITQAFIRAIPKTDLHVHLDGSLRIPTLLALADAQGVKLPARDEAGLRRDVFKDRYANLDEYLTAFGCTCSVLTTEEALARVARELVEDSLAEGVRYLEVRFAPQLHVHSGLSIVDVVRAVAEGMRSARDEFNASEAVISGRDIACECGIIACAMRYFTKHMGSVFAALFHSMPHAPRGEVFALASLELARAAVKMIEEDGLPIVGFDLAGAEYGNPAVVHQQAYRYAHSHFLQKTVHAGEAFGPESIFQAITTCHANRLGHGTFLFDAERISDPAILDKQAYVEKLADYVAKRRITMEVCLTSNLQTLPEMHSVAQHPIRKMLDHNLSVSICTDNRLVSNTSVCRELELLVSSLPVTRKEFRDIIVAGFKGSFFPGPYLSKRNYIRGVTQRYEELERQML